MKSDSTEVKIGQNEMYQKHSSTHNEDNMVVTEETIWKCFRDKTNPMNISSPAIEKCTKQVTVYKTSKLKSKFGKQDVLKADRPIEIPYNSTPFAKNADLLKLDFPDLMKMVESDLDPSPGSPQLVKIGGMYEWEPNSTPDILSHMIPPKVQYRKFIQEFNEMVYGKETSE
jgi:hypothetical protein